MSIDQDHLIHVSQTFATPLATVYDLFASADFFDFCGVDIETGSCDVRVGGAYAYVVDATDFVEGVFRVVVPQEELVFTWLTQGLNGPTGETLVKLRFASNGEQTTVCLEHSGLTHRPTAKAHEEAWREIFAAIDEELQEG